MTRWQFSHLLFISATVCLGGAKSGNTSIVKDEDGWWTIKTTGGEHGNDYGNDLEDTSYINQDYYDDDYEDSFYDAPKGNKRACKSLLISKSSKQ